MTEKQEYINFKNKLKQASKFTKHFKNLEITKTSETGPKTTQKVHWPQMECILYTQNKQTLTHRDRMGEQGNNRERGVWGRQKRAGKERKGRRLCR